MLRSVRALDRLKAARPGGRPVVERDSRWHQRGQVLVIFAGSLVALMVLMALVVDIGWYWCQRAADAASRRRRGPGRRRVHARQLQRDRAERPDAALAAAKRNGYVPDANTTITSTKDANPRQINVTITYKCRTFFLKIVGVTTLDATRSSKAEFVLPVPMGSPQNYYGVGTFVNLGPCPDDRLVHEPRRL